jgi:integrase/recombinase XerD
VGEPHVAGFLAALREGTTSTRPLAASSAGRAVVAVRGLHRFAVREGMAPTDPRREVRPPVPARRLPKAITVEQVEALLEAAGDDTPLALRDKALLEVLYGTGARISEAIGLDVDDLDLGTGGVRLDGKGGKQRVVPVGSYARAAVEAYLVRARPQLAAGGRGRRGCSSTRGAAGSRGRAPGACCSRPSRRPVCTWRSRRTRCGTRSPRTCSTAAPTCAWCRSCSGTHP